jgi:hypothetical protein
MHLLTESPNLVRPSFTLQAKNFTATHFYTARDEIVLILE